jgi:excinuclease ABC subunit A
MNKEKTYSSKDYIVIKGARKHNLKNINLAIKRNSFTVITGLSGSGKTSLAYDTIFAEGQRRYVESLSSYARQFLARMDKAEVDSIEGIAPAVAIQQKKLSSNPRSTVGTSTEIYEYLKLLFAKIGKTFSPVSGKEVKKQGVEDIISFIFSLAKNTKLYICVPIIIPTNRDPEKQLDIFVQQGFSRIYINDKIVRIKDIEKNDIPQITKKAALLIDRIKIDDDIEESRSRIADSLETAFFEGNGSCIIHYDTGKEIKKKSFSNSFSLDGIDFEEPSSNLFSFNNPYGACKRCEGFGSIIDISEDLVIPDPSLSVYEEGIACWRGEKMSKWKNQVINNAYKSDFPIHKPINELSEKQYEELWKGNKHFKGINAFFNYVESKAYKIQYRVMLSRYRGKTKCPECRGTKLRKEAFYVKIGGKNIQELVLMPIDELLAFIESLQLTKSEATIAARLVTEIKNRLGYLCDVGLSYLDLNRASNSLSGGESQRIKLAQSLGSSLMGSIYILDEPSIGLHNRDTQRLIKVLKNLQDLGNTVIVVEHDEEIIAAADEIIDIGPLAGAQGGELIFQGNYQEILKHEKSLTGAYLSGKKQIIIPDEKRDARYFIHIEAANKHNLKNINVDIPLFSFVVVSGVSGSGKTTLIKDILYSSIKMHLGETYQKSKNYKNLSGDLRLIEAVELIDQNPIGKSSRSNPITYIKAFDDIRTLFSQQKLAKVRGYKPGFFSYNVKGGRCEECQGEGQIKIEMQFLADIYLQCEACKGKRYKEECLEVKYRGKHISDILDMNVSELLYFLKDDNNPTAAVKSAMNKIAVLEKIGLGYLKVGQSSSSLSGGESQRIKLASILSKGNSEKKSLFIFDEPTTGLHFHDINKLYIALNGLIELGHSLIVIEHNMDIIKMADYVIDLGPEGGKNGGEIVFAGKTADLAKAKSHTAKYFQKKINADSTNS